MLSFAYNITMVLLFKIINNQNLSAHLIGKVYGNWKEAERYDDNQPYFFVEDKFNEDGF